MPTIVDSFNILSISGKTPKNMRFAIENQNTETAYNCRQFSYLNFHWQKKKSMRFEMKNQNTQNAYNCIQLPYLNYKWQKAKNHAFLYGKPEYGKCLQLLAVSVFEFKIEKHQKTCVLQWKTRIRKLSTIVCSFRIWILSVKTPKNMRFQMEDSNTETASNCMQFSYFNFKWQNAKIQAFCNGGHEYGNSLQL